MTVESGEIKTASDLLRELRLVSGRLRNAMAKTVSLTQQLRRREILLDCQTLESLEDVALRHNLTGARIRQILEEAKRGGAEPEWPDEEA